MTLVVKKHFECDACGAEFGRMEQKMRVGMVEALMNFPHRNGVVLDNCGYDLCPTCVEKSVEAFKNILHPPE